MSHVCSVGVCMTTTLGVHVMIDGQKGMSSDRKMCKYCHKQLHILGDRRRVIFKEVRR